MNLLENVIQNYAWGSKTAIAGLLGRAPSEKPEAELWMGAHPSAPSRIAGTPLPELIAREPEALLGATVRRRFGDKLPFLLKVLAAAEPLSLQAHPSIADAEKGFDDEERRGIKRDAPNRNYKDRNHKPELICALTPFDALYGFRDARKTLELLEALNVEGLGFAVSALRKSPDAAGLREIFEAVMKATAPETVAATVKACEAHVGPFRAECAWVSRIAKLYPGDPGLISVLLLNLVHLKPGEALYLPAGNLHAYLDGVGVEIMASSDNVLRGGLTKKHVDVQELLRVLDFTSIPPAPLRPRREGAEEIYETPAPEFRLSRISATKEPLSFTPLGPEIWLCTEGRAELASERRTLRLQQGQSAFVEANPHSSVRVSGAGVLFRATVNHL